VVLRDPLNLLVKVAAGGWLAFDCASRF
jgi:hypothetical protein